MKKRSVPDRNDSMTLFVRSLQRLRNLLDGLRIDRSLRPQSINRKLLAVSYLTHSSVLITQSCS
jgi:hypothetical protein